MGDRSMEIKQLESFVTACERGSLSQAAACMYTTQPNVSKTIRTLEHELGRPLLVRSGKGVQPTVYGKNVLEYGPCGSAPWLGAYQFCGPLFSYQHRSGAADPYLLPGLRTWSWIIRSMDCPHSRPNDKSGLFHAGIAADDPYQDEGQLKFMIALILSWHG